MSLLGFDEVDPDSTLFEALQRFCQLIGEGRIHPRKQVRYYYLLPHPVHQERSLLIHLDKSTRLFMVREAIEGFPAELYDLPLIYEFRDPKRSGMPVFPYLVHIHEKEVTLHYGYPFAHIVSSIKLPLEQYEQLKGLFDEVNPIPWTEKDDPNYDLPLQEPTE